MRQFRPSLVPPVSSTFPKWLNATAASPANATRQIAIAQDIAPFAKVRTIAASGLTASITAGSVAKFAITSHKQTDHPRFNELKRAQLSDGTFRRHPADMRIKVRPWQQHL